ncbi:MAG TPA: hypothetical protein VG144_03060 [Gaiellaceae bacterium]|jgi:hypothetical protein|nr:hypothetical protein [Gaiellaceae bacterium]
MQISSLATVQTCAICDRTLLTGERAVRYAPAGGQFLDVCPLCQEVAVEYGWVKEGTPTTPTVPVQRRKRGSWLSQIFAPVRSPTEETVASEPILRRLSEPELAMVEAADVFNASDYRRTIGGVAKSLGEPRASIRQLSGVNQELVITIAWDITWYQYRVSRESAQPVRLEARGHELGELDAVYQNWNARVDTEGRVVPDIARI